MALMRPVDGNLGDSENDAAVTATLDRLRAGIADDSVIEGRHTGTSRTPMERRSRYGACAPCPKKGLDALESLDSC